MADRRRIVTRSFTGSVTTVKDLDDGTSIFAVRDTWNVQPATRQPVWSTSTRRYTGARTVGDIRGNGQVSWTAYVKGASADAVTAAVEDLLGLLEQPRTDLWLEWRPDGATESVFYEVRGPASWSPQYRWALFAGAKAMQVEITIPVAPLGEGTPYTVALSSTALPAVVDVGVTTEASALVDVTLRGTLNPVPVFALIGWWQQPSAPSGMDAPAGIIEAEAADSATTWTSTADGNARGGNLMRATTSGAGTATAGWAIDQAAIDLDPFGSTRMLEVWARVWVASTVVSPRLATSVGPLDATLPARYSEHGTTGKLIVVPSSGSGVYRFVRLGSVALEKTPGSASYYLRVNASWAAGSSGQFGLDYVAVVPTAARAVSPTGKPNNSTYPAFWTSTTDRTRTILGATLAGYYSAGGATTPIHPAPGLGGSLIEMVNGTNKVLLKLSSLVPDDPTADTTTEALSHTVTGTFTVRPRFYLAR